MKRRGLLAALAGLTMIPGAGAAGSSYRARLLAGRKSEGLWHAGVEISLTPGWKTYWRMPGEAGIPPEFDWSKSANLAAVQVLWPAPHRYHDEGGETVGYRDHVIFPLLVTPRDFSEPVTLALDLFFAVCKEICIPAKAQASLAETMAVPAEAQMIDVFAAQVPMPVEAGSPWKVRQAAVAALDGMPVLDLAFAGAVPAENLDIFVEGGGLAYFRAPRHGSASGIYLPVDGLKDPNVLRGKSLLLTIVSGDIRLEQSVTVA